jgi:hypothetical protein
MPCSGLVLWQIGISQGFGQIAANTNFFVVRHKSRDRLTVLQKHKRNVWIVRAVNAVRNIARSFRDRQARMDKFRQFLNTDMKPILGLTLDATLSCNEGPRYSGWPLADWDRSS